VKQVVVSSATLQCSYPVALSHYCEVLLAISLQGTLLMQNRIACSPAACAPFELLFLPESAEFPTENKLMVTTLFKMSAFGLNTSSQVCWPLVNCTVNQRLLHAAPHSCRDVRGLPLPV